MLFVRPVAASDWRSYRDLRLRALRDSHEAFASTHERESVRDDDDWRARVSAVANSSTAQAFFAHWNNEACGLVWCKASDVESSVVEIFQMWVAPDARGLGAGSALLERAITWAEDRGAACVRLGVTITDSPALLVQSERISCSRRTGAFACGFGFDVAIDGTESWTASSKNGAGVRSLSRLQNSESHRS